MFLPEIPLSDIAAYKNPKSLMFPTSPFLGNNMSYLKIFLDIYKQFDVFIEQILSDDCDA